MKKSEFIDLLDNPKNIGGNNIVSLQEAVGEFPYFQSAQLALTKAFHSSENLNFENQLKVAAVYASDRKKLHQLIFTDQPVLTEAPIVDTPAEKAEEPIENSKIIKDEVVNEQESVLANEQNKSPFIPDFGSVIDESSNAATEDFDQQLQQQILSEAVHHSILMEVDDAIPEFESDDELAHNFTETLDEAPDASKENFNETEGHSFSDWLNFYSDEEKTTTTSNLLWRNTSESSKEAIKSFSPSSNLPVKQEFYSAAKMARLSVQEDYDLVTETLANVYAEQGYPEKAIIAFERLQLKYPEKKVYFAGRIKEIENQINPY